MEIIIDTREQTPWTFDPSVSVIRKALPAGDYSLVGLEDCVAIERKSLGDFVNTVIHDWIRFRKELNRLSGYDLAIVVVEAEMEDIYYHRYHSEANPNSVLGKANGILIDHGIPVLFWGDPMAADMAYRFLAQAWRKLS